MMRYRQRKPHTKDKTDTPDDAQAVPYALRVLAYRPRSEYEMRRKLEERGFSSLATDRTLAELTRLELLDDREFSRGWIDAHHGRGSYRLKQELRLKGIDRDAVEEIISTARSAEDEEALAREVALRAVRMSPRPFTRNTLLRVRRLLVRRGFASDIVNRVCAGLDHHLTDEGEWLE